MKSIDKVKRAQALRSIAAMNLKKSPGGGSAKKQILKAAALADADLLAEQFRLYHADVVICCGRTVKDLVLVDNVFGLDERPEPKRTTKGVLYKEYNQGKFIVSFAHPQVRSWQNLLFYGLVDAVRLRHSSCDSPHRPE